MCTIDEFSLYFSSKWNNLLTTTDYGEVCKLFLKHAAWQMSLVQRLQNVNMDIVSVHRNRIINKWIILALFYISKVDNMHCWKIWTCSTYLDGKGGKRFKCVTVDNWLKSKPFTIFFFSFKHSLCHSSALPRTLLSLR